MYLNYWKLENKPFSNIPDPSMYFAISRGSDPVSRLSALIKARSARLIVLTGDSGTGRTTCMRSVVDALDPHAYQIAFITNPAMTFPPLLREIVGQLQHRVCPNQTLAHFVRIFHETVSRAAADARPTLVFIDDYSATCMADLAALQSLLTEQGPGTDFFTFIVAGRPELENSLAANAWGERFQKVSAYCKTEEIRDRDALRDYVMHRLERAGRSGVSPFTDASFDALWARPANRNPRVLNSVCRLCLKKAAEAGLEQIDSELTQAVCADLHVHPLETLPPHQPLSVTRSSRATVIVPKISVDQAKERLASQLATTRIEQMDRVLDPFEAWSVAREEILSTLQSTKLNRGIS